LRGTPENARDWAVGSDDVPGFAELFTWMEVPALGRARVWITLGSHESLNRALILLEKISKRCEEWNLVNQAIETGALYSLCLEKLGRHDEAIDSLSSVLQLAGTGGWTRPFLELGADMASLIRRLAGQRKLLDFGQQLLSLYDQPIEVEGISQIDAPMTVDIAGGMTETLTKRELEILLLLAQRLQTKEMAAKLFVSTETVKSHIKRLYQKLDVHNRRDVAAFARSLIKSGRL
jgi:ATP/maltotriose-dependent transcriptional regulator MalT